MLQKDRIKQIKKELFELERKIIDPSLMGDRKGYSRLSKRYNELKEIVTCYNQIIELSKVIKESEDLISNENDKDLITLAKEELQQSISKKEIEYEKLKELLQPKDPNDEKDVIIEIRAGTGGDEAALFASDLFRMYSYYAEKNGWKLDIINANSIGIGGYKEITFSLSGDNIYGIMRFESGVHRVQRVPETEANGRIHTSAISVVVLPQADEIDVEIDEKDLKIDVYRSSGNGGQSVNTTDSAVRITHLPTNIVVTCQDEKSQLKNRIKAMSVLRSRLLDLEVSKAEFERARDRKAQVGTGDRSAKIRTYNYPQNRVTDHRINLTLYKLSSILQGNLEEFTSALKIAYKDEQIKNG